MMLKLWLLTLVLLLPSTGWASSYVGVTNSEPDAVGVASKTTPTTVVAGTDRSLVVAVQTRSSTAGSAVTGVTFGAQAFTLANPQLHTISGGTFRCDLYVLVAPTVGTDNTVVTWAGTANDSDQAYSIVQVNGVSQSSPVGATSGAGGAGTTLSSTITTVADGALIVDCALGQDDPGLTVGAGQTAQVDRIISTTAAIDGAGVSTVAKATAGTELMDWTMASGGGWVHAAISLTPSGGTDPGTSTPSKATLTWTNGFDKGSPQTGVTSATILRGTGAGCTPTIARATVPATNGSAGTYVDNSLAINTTYCYSFFNSDGAGLKSLNYTPTQYITTGGTFRNVLGVRDFSLLADSTDIGSDFDDVSAGYDNCQIVSGTARPTVLNQACLETYNAVTTPDNQWAQITSPTVSFAVSQNAAIPCRWNDSTLDGYVAVGFFSIDYYAIYEVTAGTYVELANGTAVAHVDGDKYRFECEGSTQKFYRVRGTAETLLTSSTDATILSGRTGLSMLVATGGELAGMQINHFSMGGFSTTADVEPTIIGATADLTGANLTYGAVTPSYVIVRLFNNSTSTDVRRPISDFPGGRLTQTWVVGWDGVCFLPVNSLQVTNTLPTAYRCLSLSNVVSPQDTTPPVLSNPSPTGDLPSGTTTATISVALDKNAQCRFDTTDIAVASMQTTIPMVTAGLRCSADITVASGSNGPYYVGAYITDPSDSEITYPTVTNQAITVNVLAAPGTDTTDPSTVTNLTGTLSGLVATLNWSPATDDVAVAGYQVYQSTDGCVTKFLAGAPVTSTTTQANLAFSTSYCFTVKAIDTSNNLSLNYSNEFLLTTGVFVDVIPPSPMTGLTANCSFTVSCVLTWLTGTDDRGSVTSSIEICTVISPSTDCSNFSTFQSLISISTLKAALASNTRHCFRGQHSDGTNVGGYSATVCGTTLNAGLDRPRTRIQIERLPRL